MEVVQQIFTSLFDTEKLTGNAGILLIIWIVIALINTFILPMYYKSKYKELHDDMITAVKKKNEVEEKKILAKVINIQSKYLKYNYSFSSIASNLIKHAWQILIIMHFITPIEYHPLWIAATVYIVFKLIFNDIMVSEIKLPKVIVNNKTKLHDFLTNQKSDDDQSKLLSELAKVLEKKGK